MRKQRPRGTTTREAIVNAALAIVDEHGIDGLTIRGVAEAVAAPPMSLYTYFANKNALLDLMFVELARRMYADDGNASWQAELGALCHRVRDLLTEHPRWAELLSRPAPPLDAPVRERILNLMVADGLSPAFAYRVFATPLLFAPGFALLEIAMRRPDGSTLLESRFDKLKQWIQTTPDHPVETARAAMTKFARLGMDESFEFLVAAFLKGAEEIARDARARPAEHGAAQDSSASVVLESEDMHSAPPGARARS